MDNKQAIQLLKTLKDILPYHNLQSQAIDHAIVRLTEPVSGSTSDGYHTFDELYHHRAVLFATVCKAYPDKAWRSKKHHDGSMFGDDWFICGVKTPDGQYSYHYRISEYWQMFDCCKTLDFAPEWDGHQPKDVDRLLSLQLTEPTDTEIADAIKHLEFEKKRIGLLIDERSMNGIPFYPYVIEYKHYDTAIRIMRQAKGERHE